ncbi:fibrinogen-like protein 1 [Drosophila montana]|uniref:fibrinogen-like protein 1 n=1 Tax=Drosophila montana TaxID=40370 RepID=UPI00313AFED5
MRYILGLIILCLTWQVCLTDTKSFSHFEFIPAEEQPQSVEMIVVDGQGITETYDQTSQEETLLKLNVSSSEKDDIVAVNCEVNAEEVSKMKRQVAAFRSKITADSGKVKELKDLIAAYEAQIDSNVAALNEQQEQIGYLNNSIAFYRTTCNNKDVELTDLQVRAKADAAKLRQKNDQLSECRDRINTLAASSCLTFGNSSDIQVLNVPGVGPFLAPCESRYQGSGWTVIQRRLDGSVNFNRNWNDYRNGFGDLNGEFFIGLEKLHRMTVAQPHELLVFLEAFTFRTKFITFSKFLVGSEDTDYELQQIEFNGSYYDGNGRALTYNIRQKFSTYDRDNDNYWVKNCAKAFKGGWWFNSCDNLDYFANLNGEYKEYKPAGYNGEGIIWNVFDGSTSLRSVQMMIRPKPEETN